RPARELLHQHRLPADLPLLPGDEGDPRLPHLARGHARAGGDPGRLLRLPRPAQALRRGALGRRRGRAPRPRHPALAPLRPRDEGGPPQRLRDGDAARAGRDRRAARRLLPPPRRVGHRDPLPERRPRGRRPRASASRAAEGPQDLSGSPFAFFSRRTSRSLAGPPLFTISWNWERKFATRLTRSMTMWMMRQASFSWRSR